VTIVLPHWGPNMRASPVQHVRRAAAALEAAGATLIAGHSAHVPQGPSGRTLFDLGDFIDDYAVDPGLRNDLGVLWLVTLDADFPRRVEGTVDRLGTDRGLHADDAIDLTAVWRAAPWCGQSPSTPGFAACPVRRDTVGWCARGSPCRPSVRSI
jgi:hypothetical protein